MKKSASVLILYTGNSCRSQMAEGVLMHYGGVRFDVESAGTMPSKVNETAIFVMKEIKGEVIVEFRRVRDLILEKFKKADREGLP